MLPTHRTPFLSSHDTRTARATTQAPAPRSGERKGYLGTLDGLPLIARQREEVFLTAAQSFFAVAVLLNLSMSVREAMVLFGLFWAQFITGAVVPREWHGAELVIFALVYLLLGAWVLFSSRRQVPRLAHDGFRADYAELSSDRADPPSEPP